MQEYIRWQEESLKQVLAERRVVSLTGPRQCGKTTLVRKLVQSDVIYRTLDDVATFDAAVADPNLFIQNVPNNVRDKGTFIIDEIQKVPELLPTIKKIVDQSNRPGQFLITGSANILTLPTVKESMAGRMAMIRLSPLSIGEILYKKPCFLKSAFAQKFTTRNSLLSQNNLSDLDSTALPTRNKLISLVLKGGYPEAIRLKGKIRKNWYVDYINALIERDLSDYADVRKVSVIKDLVGVLAAWSSKYIDFNAIGSGLTMDRRTLQNYINILEAFYIVARIPAWRKTDYDRVGKLDKFVMTDTGMISELLGVKINDVKATQEQVDQDKINQDKIGKIFETFVYNELMIQADNADDIYNIYHYRDRQKREIDLVIESPGQGLILVEVKSGITVRSSDFKYIKWFQDNLVKPEMGKAVGVVLYPGDDILSFGKNLWAVPMWCMWE